MIFFINKYFFISKYFIKHDKLEEMINYCGGIIIKSHFLSYLFL
jgi:hypothetical protein